MLLGPLATSGGFQLGLCVVVPSPITEELGATDHRKSATFFGPKAGLAARGLPSAGQEAGDEETGDACAEGTI